ncbi:MAG: hypothetical protein H7210_03665 [Pyrinomonadaceae bacterium]|nr:hypothetical protein [Phycisphaerales bacterium]
MQLILRRQLFKGRGGRGRRVVRLRRGFTLIEATLSVLVVGVMLAAAMRVLGASVRTRASGRDQAHASLLARRLLEEIMQKRYVDPDSDVGENRLTYDDVDDYNLWGQSPPTEIDGSAMSGYTGWSVSASVVYADAESPEQNGNSSSGLKRISVKVTTRSGTSVTLTGLRAVNGMADRQLLARRNYAGFSNIKLRVGTTGSDVVLGVNPLNQVP